MGLWQTVENDGRGNVHLLHWHQQGSRWRHQLLLGHAESGQQAEYVHHGLLLSLLLYLQLFVLLAEVRNVHFHLQHLELHRRRVIVVGCD